MTDSEQRRDPRRVPPIVWWLLVLFAVVTAAAVIWGVPHFQDDLTASAQDALDDAGIDGVEVEFNGRDGELSGDVGLADDAQRAEQVVADLRGVRRVDAAALGVSAAPPDEAPVRTTITLDPTTTAASTTTEAPAATVATAATFGAVAGADAVTLRGALPTQADVDAVAAAAEARYTSVDNQLAVDANTTGAWVGDLPGLFGAAEGWSGWTLDVDDTGARFQGLAPDAAAIAGLRDGYLAGLFPGGLDFGAEVDPSAVAAQLTGLLEGSTTFESGSATLAAEAQGLLDQAIELLLANPATVLTVEGHTDDQGDDDFNLELSQTRAQAVVDYLVAGGVEGDRLTAVGFGESQPIADNSTAEGRAENRRIEFAVETEGQG